MSDSSPIPSALDGLASPPTPSGMPPADRFRDVGQAYSAYKEMRQGDRLSAMNRIRYEMKLAGEPPYSPAEMKKYGLATAANVNFGFMEDALTAASAPYEDLVDGSEVLLRLPTKYGFDTSEKQAWQSVMEAEFTALITDDDGFDYQLAELVRQFNLHGIAVPFFEDRLGISWQTTETGNFLLPRDCRASTKSIDLACCVREYLPHQLFECIENRQEAEEEGWNIEATRIAIKAATPGVDWYDDWEKWVEQWKNNDYGMSYGGRSSVTRIVHMWVVQRKGNAKVQHLMFQADGSGKDFIFKSKKLANSLGESFTIFTDGVGVNGKYHGIRGIGYKLYAIIKEMDELWSSFIDATRQAGKIFIQPKSEGASKNLALVEWGNYLLLPPNANFIPRDIPNYGQNIIPGLNLLQQLLASKTGQWSTQGAFDQKKAEQTAKEIMARLDQIAKLSTTKVKIFYSAWERHLKEQLRRVIRKDWHETDPDYARVKEFYDRCEAQGVPKEAIHGIDLRHVKAVRAMGAGSPEARQALFDRLFQMFEYYDAEGKQKLVRAATVSVAGKDMGDMLSPPVPGQRPPVDKKIADLENGQMAQGIAQTVEPNEMHAVHVTQHLTGSGGLLELVQQYEAGQIGLEAIPIMRLLQLHCDGNPETGEVGHMQYIPESLPNGTPNMERARFKEALQQSEGVIWNGEKKIRAEQERAAEEAGQAQQEGALGHNESRAIDEAEVSLMKVQQEAAAQEEARRQREEDHQQMLRHKEENFKQEQILKQQSALAEKAKQDADQALKALSAVAQPPPAKAA